MARTHSTRQAKIPLGAFLLVVMDVQRTGQIHMMMGSDMRFATSTMYDVCGNRLASLSIYTDL